MRDLHTERRQYREVTREVTGLSPSAGFGPGAYRIFAPSDMDPADVRRFLEGTVDTTNQKPLQPDPPAPPVLRYWVPGLDDLMRDPSDPRFPPRP